MPEHAVQEDRVTVAEERVLEPVASRGFGRLREGLVRIEQHPALQERDLLRLIEGDPWYIARPAFEELRSVRPDLREIRDRRVEVPGRGQGPQRLAQFAQLGLLLCGCRAEYLVRR